ncbi:relaxase/mobilization nuclease domain-containing protein [Facivitalis istanbulensis]|uniref:relaxase/mobilization nuclease domain-containing protein n=1 Tax=Facivitalis istanbulensis TaxID=3075838 RepID=UPI00387B6FF9
MSNDDDFTPDLGKPRAGGSRMRRTYLQRVLQARTLAGGARRTGRAFTGSRIGRGRVAGRQLASRDRFSAHRQRRVMVKYRIAKFNKTNSMGAARAHLRYIQRDGVTREGEPGRLYSDEQDGADGKAFLERCDGDRHQFRFIVSPEDGQHYDDLKSLTRRLMTQMEEDLGTKLDWVAVDHFNTGHPHTHIVVRGKDERGRDLGSGLVDHSQKMTVAASAMAEKNAVGHRS